MLDWIKRAWREWFGPKSLPKDGLEPSKWTGLHQGYPVVVSPLFERPDYNQREVRMAAAHAATAAQKNLRLHSIARERSRLKDEIARLKRNKKRHMHLVAELGRLTRLELQLEGGN